MQYNPLENRFGLNREPTRNVFQVRTSGHRSTTLRDGFRLISTAHSYESHFGLNQEPARNEVENSPGAHKLKK